MHNKFVEFRHGLGKIYTAVYKEYLYLSGKKMRGAYQIAFRKIENGGLLNNELGRFCLVPNLRQGFSADPFLFEYNGEIYLFAEIMNNRTGNGEIGYCKWNGRRFSKWKIVIRENYHLSYPLVFKKNGCLYLMPEAKKSHSLYTYKAVDFPNKWEKQQPIIENIDICDTTLFKENGHYYAFTTVYDDVSFWLELFSFDNEIKSVLSRKVISKNTKISRCGGNIINNNGKMIRVAQDCSKEYGEKLIFLETTMGREQTFFECHFKEIDASNIAINKPMLFTRIHTYNILNNIEVIDLFSR